MENLYIEGTKYSLEINLNTNGTFQMSGRSFPENTFEFYAPMLNWIKEYFENCAVPITTFNLEITYCNSGSTMLLFDLFDLLQEYSSSNDIIVNWNYDKENDNMEEMGVDIVEEFPNLNINLIIKN